MAKDGTNRGGPRPGTGPKRKPLADKITDGTAKGTLVMPDDFPEPGEEITVSGVFDFTTDGQTINCILRQAVMEE